jgi:hypothetical protein
MRPSDPAPLVLSAVPLREREPATPDRRRAALGATPRPYRPCLPEIGREEFNLCPEAEHEDPAGSVRERSRFETVKPTLAFEESA